MNILDPSQYPSPILDYSAELPTEMTPEKLLVVYGTLWALQDEARKKMIADSPTKLTKSVIEDQLEQMFEAHRVEAFERVMDKTLEKKSDAQLFMVKAYITYASCETLEGYPNGGKSWLIEFNDCVRRRNEQQAKDLS